MSEVGTHAAARSRACANKKRLLAPLPVVAVWARDLLVSLAISAFIIIFLYQPVKVEGTSMMPGLEDQERIFVNKFVYRWEPIQRGDIVVFRYPRDTSKSYIKRVIGIAGDRIRIENGQVYVNGEALDEDYVPKDYADARSYGEIVVPREQLLRPRRPSHHVERQPRLWAGERTLYLRQSRLRILADGKAGKAALAVSHQPSAIRKIKSETCTMNAAVLALLFFLTADG